MIDDSGKLIGSGLTGISLKAVAGGSWTEESLMLMWCLLQFPLDWGITDRKCKDCQHKRAPEGGDVTQAEVTC